MSQTGANVDIEDILASVRRLVREGAPAAHRPEAGAAVQQADAGPVTPPAGAGDRLVLTPALRVPEAQGKDQDDAPQPLAPDQAHALEEAHAAAPGLRPAPLLLVPTPEAPPHDPPPDAAAGDPSAEIGPDPEPEEEPGPRAARPPRTPWVVRRRAFRDAQAPASGGGETEEELRAPMDEAALRALMAQVVRQELEGPLGERITENVRRIIQHEVAAALAGRTPG